MDKIVNLGDEVKDQITGFKGIAVLRARFLFGCVRVEVQPAKLKKDGSKTESQFFDEVQLTVTRKSVHKIPEGYVPTVGIVDPGDEVCDIISGLKGIVNQVSEYIDGFARVEIQPRKVSENKPVESIFIGASRARIISKNKITPTIYAKVQIEKKKSTGGPAREKAWNTPKEIRR